MPREVVFVAGLHGDESMPVRALKDKGISFLFGSPKAAKKNVRFTGRDLNASFGLRGSGYEIKRAAQILKAIDRQALVVDFHSTSAVTPPFAIVVDKKLIPFAATAGLKYVVVMKHNIKKGRALINCRSGFSVETGRHGSAAAYRQTLRVVKNVRAGKRHPVKVFEVFGVIPDPGRYVNFKKHRSGFFPVLAGERAYDFYGLKAKEIKSPPTYVGGDGVSTGTDPLRRGSGSRL